MIEKITIEEIEHIVFTYTIKKLTFNEPIPDFSTRFPNILESCLRTPFQTFSAKDLYPTLVSKAGILFYLMIKNHPFQNGNKRLAFMTLLYFLFKHNKWLRVNTKTMYETAVFVAGSPAFAKKEVLKYVEKFIEVHLIPYKK